MADEPITPTPTDPAPNPESPEPKPKFTQEQVNSMLAEERRKAEEKAERDRKATEDKAKEDALKEQGEFRTLADQRAARITELEAEAGRVETLTEERDAALAVIESLVESELKAAPEYVRDAIADRSPVDKLDYLGKHRDKWTDGKAKGIGPTHNGSRPGPQTREDIRDKYLKQAGRI